MLRRGAEVIALPGSDPAIGGGMIAWHIGSLVTVARRDNLTPVLTLRVRGVEKLAVSDRWLVYRANGTLRGRRLASPRRALRIALPRRGGQVGRPALNGDTVVYSVTGSAGSAIAAVDLRRRHGRVIRRALTSQFLNPSLLAGHLLYVGESRCSQLLRLGLPDRRHERFLLSLAPLARRDSGHEHGHTRQGSETGTCAGGARRLARSVLWTTALSRRYAYVTVLSLGAAGLGSPRIVRVKR
jgi:hypothetical protein